MLRNVLFFLCLISYSRYLRIYLHNFIHLAVYKLSDALQSFITFLHTEQSTWPILKQSFFWHNDSFNLNSGFFKGVSCSSRFFFLRNQLCLVKSLLLVKSFDLLIHRVYQMILLFLDFFKISDVLFSSVSRSSCQSNFTLHDFVVFFNLFQCPVELVEFLLSL